MAKPRAVTYAEDVLGVHKLYEDAQVALKEYEQALLEQADARQAVRGTRASIAEFERVTEERVRQSGVDYKSVAAFERAVKAELTEFSTWTDLADALASQQDRADETEAFVKIAGSRLNLLTTRMEQVGQYLGYLNSCKAASTAARQFSELPW